ncbi:Fic family protein [Photorhabdus australis]|uniref:Fic family protein n=1 Tax=Photorhabdus australis TaxID=286156 RepID=UPI0005630A63|nr:Fic family protein [Photorhabdus australis]
MNSMTNIYETLRVASQPMSVSDLLAEHPSVPRRTVQRWLGQLVEDGKIHALGEGRNRRYVVSGKETSKQVIERSGNFPSYIPLSEDSKDVLGYVDQPMEARVPVGYQREFLESYEPNVTHYLSVPIRNHLWRIGGTKQTSQPAGTYGRAILDRLLIDLSWASSRLEGNTYSRLDTIELIEYGKIAVGKDAIETQMILNHKSAIELLVDGIVEADFNRYTILNLHSALSENLLLNPIDEGRIRQHQVEIGKSVFRPLSGEVYISEVLDSLLAKAQVISDPFEQSFFIMVHLPYLQPFADINKRTSRLAANLPLLRSNLCPLTFLDVPEEAYSRAMLGVYEMTRVELLRDLYLWAYERSTQEYLALRQEITEPDPLRLQYRNTIKQVVYQVVVTPEMDSLEVIDNLISNELSPSERDTLKALVIEELRRLHEGVLARYGLRPAQFKQWKEKHR